MSEAIVPNPQEVANRLAAQKQRALEEAITQQWVDVGDKQSMADFADYLNSRPYQDGQGVARTSDGRLLEDDYDTHTEAEVISHSSPSQADKRLSYKTHYINTRIAKETLAETKPHFDPEAYKSMSLSAIAKELAKARANDDQTTFMELDTWLHEKIEAWGDKHDRSDEARETLYARLHTIQDQEFERLTKPDAKQPADTTPAATTTPQQGWFPPVVGTTTPTGSVELQPVSVTIGGDEAAKPVADTANDEQIEATPGEDSSPEDASDSDLNTDTGDHLQPGTGTEEKVFRADSKEGKLTKFEERLKAAVQATKDFRDSGDSLMAAKARWTAQRLTRAVARLKDFSDSQTKDALLKMEHAMGKPTIGERIHLRRLNFEAFLGFRKPATREVARAVDRAKQVQSVGAAAVVTSVEASDDSMALQSAPEGLGGLAVSRLIESGSRAPTIMQINEEVERILKLNNLTLEEAEDLPEDYEFRV